MELPDELGQYCKWTLFLQKLNQSLTWQICIRPHEFLLGHGYAPHKIALADKGQ